MDNTQVTRPAAAIATVTVDNFVEYCARRGRNNSPFATYPQRIRIALHATLAESEIKFNAMIDNSTKSLISLDFSKIKELKELANMASIIYGDVRGHVYALTAGDWTDTRLVTGDMIGADSVNDSIFHACDKVPNLYVIRKEFRTAEFVQKILAGAGLC